MSLVILLFSLSLSTHSLLLFSLLERHVRAKLMYFSPSFTQMHALRQGDGAGEAERGIHTYTHAGRARETETLTFRTDSTSYHGIGNNLKR